MAVISSYERYNGTTIRLGGFRTDGVIIDCRAMTSDYVETCENPTEVPGTTGSISAGKPTNSYYKTKMDNAGNRIQPINVDVSQENSPYDSVSCQDPYDTEYSYVFSLSGSNLYFTKLDSKGNVIRKNYTASAYSFRVIDITETHVLITYVYSTSESYLALISKNALDITGYINIDSGVNSMSPTQFFGKNGTKYVFYSYGSAWNTGKLIAIETSNPVSLTKADLTRSDSNTSGGFSAYSSHSRWSLKMKNGYHYRINPYTYSGESVIAVEGIKPNIKELSYVSFGNVSSVNKTNVTIGELCDPSINGVLKYSGPSYNNYIFETFKVSDNHFVVISVLHNNSTSLDTWLAQGYKTIYYFFEINNDDPTKVTLKNCQKLKYGYSSMIMQAGNNKFMLVQEGLASHCYKPNFETFTLDLIWEIKTPDISWATFYNNLYWWVNNTTNELNYEVEDSTIVIDSGFEQTSFQLESQDKPKMTKYYIQLLDGDGKRLVRKVRVDLTGVATFGDDTKSKIITTSASDKVTADIKVINSGKAYATATILLAEGE
ncbi:TPA: hypothetical protein SFZ43_000087 [Campylobacter jejuni]|nr:hypothetical protein [Campylobacter jejuni]